MYQIIELSNIGLKCCRYSVKHQSINQKVDPLHISFDFCYLINIYLPFSIHCKQTSHRYLEPRSLIDPNLDHPDFATLRRQYMYVKSTCAWKCSRMKQQTNQYLYLDIFNLYRGRAVGGLVITKSWHFKTSESPS